MGVGRRSGDRFDCLGPRETELHCQCGSQIERKQEREDRGVPGLGERGMDGWREGERGMDSTQRRGVNRGREGLSHQCVYISTYGPLNFFLLQNHHRVSDRHWVCEVCARERRQQRDKTE